MILIIIIIITLLNPLMSQIFPKYFTWIKSTCVLVTCWV